MSRRTTATLVAAGALLGACVVPATAAEAAPAPAAAAAAAAAAPAPAATGAAATRAVALLVQYPNAGVRTFCVRYRAGMSGADVLAPAKPTYGTGPYAGFVLKIGGTGAVPPTSQRYWAYWQSETGRAADYAYSSTGVTSTRPPAKSVQAWVFTTGAGTTFPHRSYASICPEGA